MNKLKGNLAEALAVNYLERLGLKILQRNLLTPFGEIDILAEETDTLAFIEVKSRQGGAAAAEAVNARKQKHLTRSALFYLQRNQLLDRQVRFDVVTVNFDTLQGTRIEYMREAFAP